MSIDDDDSEIGEKDEEKERRRDEGSNIEINERPNVSSSIDNVISDHSHRNEDAARSVTTIISEKIRSKLPRISKHFKGLLRSINSKQFRENSDARIIYRKENSLKNIEELDGTSSNRNTEEVFNVATTSCESNERNDEDSFDHSTSSSMFTINDEDQREEQEQQAEEESATDERMVSFDYANISNRFDLESERRLTRMVSNSMNTIDITPDFNLENNLGGGAIIVQNPIQFAAALSMQYRLQGSLEPLNVPGLFYNQEEQSYQSESYTDDRTNDSSVNGSSTAYGLTFLVLSGKRDHLIDNLRSEVSSFTDTEELERRDQATGQDDELQILSYDPRISIILRKPLYRQDDEPSIY
ncbi:kinesin-related protein 3 isoform X1 [Vespula squamosa]|uniref:Kinesin-related protein 3 isoform X1 n=1 Tax=Vespula squamosa TaxID=30214 RepID=A0ABD2A3J7_VESSQ